MKLKPKEKDIQRAILEYLSLIKLFHFRNNTGAVVSSYKGKQRFFRYGMAGSGDILGILPDGRFFSIEVKVPGRKPTECQLEFMVVVRKSNGVAFVAYSVDDVISELKKARTPPVVVQRESNLDVVYANLR